MTLAFDHPSIDRLTDWFDLHAGLSALETASHLPRSAETRAGFDTEAPIAIIGIGCRFPGQAEDGESFWANLTEGRNCITEVPAARWDVDAFYDPDPDAPGRMITRYGGFVDDIDAFDAPFFGVSPREAVQLDPQHRMLLETAWKSMENAGLPVEDLRARPTGVFVGISINDYSQVLARSGDPTRLDDYLGMGNATSMAAGRIAHFMGLEGPAIAVDTACSSSLTSLHMACEALRRGDCHVALAGGVNSILAPEINISLSKARMLAPDGRCKTFDGAADGYVRGEGCGILTLKRLDDAEADGDRIVAVIRASGVNHDGRASGLTVPNGVAQERLLNEVLDRAGLTPGDVDYVEAHGTGTPLGDPIEVQAVAAVYGKARAPYQPMLIGTVKTNIGHLESAAGVAGVIKAALALRHGVLPPSLHFQDPNPRIDWASTPVKVVDQMQSFPAQDRPSRAAVSSFGFSGTNAHMILEAAPPHPEVAPPAQRVAHAMALSAKTEGALSKLADAVAEALVAPDAAPLPDLCFAANAGRSAFPFRLCAVAESAADMAMALRAGAQTPTDIRPVQSRFAMLFSGQGAQTPGMGQALYHEEPQFAAALDRAGDALDPHLARPLKDLLWCAGPEILSQTEFTQPALFAIEYALAQTWSAWGVTPRLLIGHSIGEYAVAVQAGVLALEEAAQLVAARGRLMQTHCPPGAMLALSASASEARAIAAEVGSDLALAAVNAANATVLSGTAEAVDAAAIAAERAGHRATRLDVSHAFHSPLMEPMLAEFEATARRMTFHPAEAEVISTLTGRKIAGDEMSDADYWVRQIREPVLFGDAVRTAVGLGMGAFLEAGPKPVLLGMASAGGGTDSLAMVPSLIPERDETTTMLTALGKLWSRGTPVDWRAVDAPYAGGRADLPGTVFEKTSFWPDVPPAHPDAMAAPAPLATSQDIFPGKRIVSPAFSGALHATTYDLHLPRFLDDHRIYGMIVVPGAAHLSMALTAVAQEAPDRVLALEAINFDEVLVVPDDESRDVQITLAPQDSKRGFEVFSRASEGDDWIRHAWGAVETTPSDLSQGRDSLDAIRARCSDEIASTDIFYRMLYRQGIQLGRQFQWVERVWKGEGEALAYLRAPEPGDEPEHYYIPPGLLDSIFQSMGATLSTKELEAGAYIPIAIENLVIQKPPAGRLINHVRLRPTDPARPELRVSDMTVTREDGTLVAEVTGLRIHRAPREALRRFAQRHLRDAIYAPVWVERPAAQPDGSLPGQTWLVFGAEDDQMAAITARFMAEDANVLPVVPGAAFTTSDVLTIRPEHGADYAALLEAVSGDQRIDGIVFLWPAAFAPSSATPEAVEDTLATGPLALFHLAQALSMRRGEAVPRLVVATEATQSVTRDESDLGTGDTGIWGLGRVISNELPDSRTLRIDLPASGDADVIADYLAIAVQTNDEDDELAFRDGRRYALRLTRWAESRGASEGGLDLGSPYQLIRAENGLLEDMQLAAVERPAPAPDEIEILSDAAGLNFRDVLNALAVYPGDAGPMGGEVVGTVTAFGSGVSAFAAGDRVMAIGAGTFARHVVTKAVMARKLPDTMTVEDAATVPVAYVSAWLGLVDMAHMKAGDKVL
ncbi:MAG: beta-ketoacyl synthase N-terminal-like domain-containing protein, partial [Pseudomonadota bacterium]